MKWATECNRSGPPNAIDVDHLIGASATFARLVINYYFPPLISQIILIFS